VMVRRCFSSRTIPSLAYFSSPKGDGASSFLR